MPEGAATPLTVAQVHALHLAGAIPAGRYRDAIRFARDDEAWLLWGRRSLLAMAMAQILAGVVFFFAYNWADLPPSGKFAVIEGSLVVAAVAAWRMRGNPAASAMLLVVAAVLVGVLLAVFGQIYQTGADAWQLFFGWAALILPWVIAGRAAVLWVLWLGVANTAALSYGAQIALPAGSLTHVTLSGAVACANLVALAAGEAAVMRGADWLYRRWARLLVLTAVLLLLLGPAVEAVVLLGSPDARPGGAAALAGFTAACVASAYVYTWRLRDMAAVALAVFAAAVLAAVAGIWHLTPHLLILGSMTVAALLTLIFGSAAALLVRLRRIADHD